MATRFNIFLFIVVLIVGCSGLKKDPWKYEESVDKLTKTKKLSASADFDSFKEADGLQVNALFECSGTTPADFLLTISTYDQKTKGDRMDGAPLSGYKLRWGSHYMTLPVEKMTEKYNNEALINGNSINSWVYSASVNAGEIVLSDIEKLNFITGNISDFSHSEYLNDLSANPQAIIQLTTSLGNAELDIDLKNSSLRKVVEACGYNLEVKKNTAQVAPQNNTEPTTTAQEAIDSTATAAPASADDVAAPAPAAEAATISASNNTVTLETASYVINITQNCPEGDIACNDVTYVGKSKKSGNSITLKGRVLPDVGYEFSNGNIKYVIQDEGEAATLIVTQGNKTLVQENGAWSTQ